MPMIPFRRRDNPYLLVVGMSGVKMGDRLLQVGCAHGGRLGAIAVKVGLSGRAAAVVPDAAAAARARKGASQAGALVDVDVAPPTGLPVANDAYDVVIVDDTAGLLAGMAPPDAERATLETFRVLRPGGRVLVMGAVPRRGLAALWSGAAGPPFDPTPLLDRHGFRSARTLAERDGLIFVEAIKPRV